MDHGAFVHGDGPMAIDECMHHGEGIVAPDADATVRNIGRIASEGMVETDQTIISIMQQDCK